MKLNNKMKFLGVFTILGGLTGFLYWYFIGCSSGSCAIKSRWYLSTLYGVLFGYLIGGSIFDFREKSQKKKETGPVGE